MTFYTVVTNIVDWSKEMQVCLQEAFYSQIGS